MKPYVKKYKDPISMKGLRSMARRLDDMIDDYFCEVHIKFEAGLITRNELLQKMVMLEDVGAVTRP